MTNVKHVLEFKLMNVQHVNLIVPYKVIIHAIVMMDTIYTIMIV